MSLAAIEVPRLEELTGAQRTAILVMYLERGTARSVLSHFDDDELQPEAVRQLHPLEAFGWRQRLGCVNWF